MEEAVCPLSASLGYLLVGMFMALFRNSNMFKGDAHNFK